ncbi:MAG: DNA polymerase III subunit delta' [Clostridia bacterium]|nr:DNA polymerase III subunit delta' [Clostridia bacterium]
MIGPERFLSQGEGVRSLLEQIQENRANHAVLISGEAGTGKWTLARGLAAALLCQGEGTKPCGRCKACLQMEELAHPDVITLEKGKHLTRADEGKAKNNITIGDVREMIRQTAQHGMEGSRRVVLVKHAEDMRDDAQNALLKTLEEPPEGTFFFLTARRPETLLPTIISRCRPLRLRPWTETEMEKVLAELGTDAETARKAIRDADGSLGQAIRLAGDEAYWAFREEVMRDWMNCPSRSEILKVSGKWKDRKDEGEAVFALLERIFSRMMRRGLRVSQGEAEDALSEQWRRFAEKATAADYVKVLDRISLARERSLRNVQFQVIVEQLILDLMEAVSI